MDQGSFSRLCGPHRPALLSLATRLTRNRATAQDVVQDALLRALRAWQGFMPDTGDPERDTYSWLRRILVNGFITSYRTDTRHRKLAEEWPGEMLTATYGTTDDVAELAEDESVGDEVQAAMDTLDDAHREVVERADFRGEHYSQIARDLRVPIGTVMSRLHRARRRLGDLLEGYARSEYGIRRPTVLVQTVEVLDLRGAAEHALECEAVETEQTETDGVDRVVAGYDASDLLDAQA